jgi:hypothetical protein
VIVRKNDDASGAVALRRAEATDAAAIRELTRRAYAKWIPVIGREPLPMAADYEQALTKHRFDLLYLEGKLAALIETIPQADHLLIENVAVSVCREPAVVSKTRLSPGSRRGVQRRRHCPSQQIVAVQLSSEAAALEDLKA